MMHWVIYTCYPKAEAIGREYGFWSYFWLRNERKSAKPIVPDRTRSSTEGLNFSMIGFCLIIIKAVDYTKEILIQEYADAQEIPYSEEYLMQQWASINDWVSTAN